jgi:RNA polymerase sigma-70 factor, ECF subfamily
VEAATTPRTDLLEAVRHGDRAAFGALVREHQRSVFFLALRLSRGDEQLARDVTQKTFLKAWAAREGFRGEASFKTWVLRIAGNLASNELRRAWRRREVVPSEPDGSPTVDLGRVEASAFEQLAASEARGLLREAVAALPDRQRSVALLRLYEDLSFHEIGGVCDITANNAKVNFHHAVRNIRRYLQDKGVAA